MVTKLCTDADTTQKLLDQEKVTVQKIQDDVKADKELRAQEKQVMTADADTNQKQLIESKGLVTKLRTDYRCRRHTKGNVKRESKQKETSDRKFAGANCDQNR